MNIFLDTNILIDLLAARAPFGEWAMRIFLQSRAKKWRLWTSSFSILTAYYIIEKQLGPKRARKAIAVLLEKVSIVGTSKVELQNALELKFKDYEDAVQYACALSNDKIEIIITRNKKDFKMSRIKVLSSEEFVLAN